MKRIVAACLVLIASLAPARSQDGEIAGVISRQIEAFLADDMVTAWGFASPGIQSMFGTPEIFGEMVRGGYPMVWRPASVRFGDLRTGAAGTVQTVWLTDGAGRLWEAEYDMVQTEEGWRIDGVRIREVVPGA